MYRSLSKYVADITLPRFVRVRQHFDNPCLSEEEILNTLRLQLSRTEIASEIHPGQAVCIPCGSRGIDHLPLILRFLADWCRQKGAVPCRS